MNEPRQPFGNGEPGLFDQVDPEAEAAADARALADIEAGRVISHEAVKRWLTDIINGKRTPRPRPGE